MKTHVHLISNNNFLDSLYELNLRAYVGIDLVVHSNRSSLQKEISKKYLGERIFLVSSSKVIDFKETFESLKSDSQNKIYLIGEITNSDLDALGFEVNKIFKNKYDLREMIRAFAKKLNVTAKDMIELNIPDYYPVSSKIFKFLKSSSVDVFNINEGEYALLFKASAAVDVDLITEEDEFLYINANERLKFINHSSVLIIEELRNEELTTFEKVELVSQGAQFVAEQISESEELTTELTEISNLCVKAFKNISSGVPKAKNLIQILLENKDGFIYSHSIFATYISRELISKMPWGSKEQQEKVAFVLFFHDLFLVPIYAKYDAVDEEELLFRDDVTEVDKEVIFDHAYLASNFIRGYPKAPMGADTLLAQHHGSTSGKGFPGIFGDDISPLAKVILISHDIAKHVFENVSDGQKSQAFDKKLIVSKLKERYQRHTYKKIIEAFMDVDL